MRVRARAPAFVEGGGEGAREDGTTSIFTATKPSDCTLSATVLTTALMSRSGLDFQMGERGVNVKCDVAINFARGVGATDEPRDR